MISNNFCTIIFGRLGDRVRGPLLPPFSSDPLIKSFHFWPRPASHQYQKSERASEASFHPYFYSLLHCWARRTIYAAGACHNFCDCGIPLFFSFFLRSSILFRGEGRGEKSDDAEKRSCHRRQTEKGPTDAEETCLGVMQMQCHMRTWWIARQASKSSYLSIRFLHFVC